LRGDDPAHSRGMRASARGLRLAFFHRGHGVDPRGSKSGQDSEEDTAEHGDGDGEGKDATVHFEIEKYLALLRGNETDEQRAAPTREKNPENRTHSRKHDAFGEDLTDETSA